MAGTVQEAIYRLCDGGHLLGVEECRFGGDSAFVTAIRLRFKGNSVTFRAVEDDDTVAAEWDGSESGEGVWVDVSGHPVWSECVGGHAAWAWQLTNQQGYSDGVRIEFEPSGHGLSRVIELVVVASAFKLFAPLAWCPRTGEFR